MGSRSHTTFKKRQKEAARAEKARMKAAKRMERKLEKRSESENGSPVETEPEASNPPTAPTAELP